LLLILWLHIFYFQAMQDVKKPIHTRQYLRLAILPFPR